MCIRDSTETMVEAAKIVEESHPDILDINFGCPVKRVAGKGAGAGMLQNIPLMLEITRAVVDLSLIHILNHKSICLTFPLLNKDRVQFKLNAIEFLSFPAFESKGVIVDRTAAVSTDIEGLAVFFYFLHDFLGT